jgi:hypothetical protein
MFATPEAEQREGFQSYLVFKTLSVTGFHSVNKKLAVAKVQGTGRTNIPLRN